MSVECCGRYALAIFPICSLRPQQPAMPPQRGTRSILKLPGSPANAPFTRSPIDNFGGTLITPFCTKLPQEDSGARGSEIPVSRMLHCRRHRGGAAGASPAEQPPCHHFQRGDMRIHDMLPCSAMPTVAASARSKRSCLLPSASRLLCSARIQKSPSLQRTAPSRMLPPHSLHSRLTTSDTPMP